MTQEEFDSWRAFKPTVDIMKHLKRRQRNLEEKLHQLCLYAQTSDPMVIAARYAGMIAELDNLLNFEYTDMEFEGHD